MHERPCPVYFFFVSSAVGASDKTPEPLDEDGDGMMSERPDILDRGLRVALECGRIGSSTDQEQDKCFTQSIDVVRCGASVW